MTSSSLHSRDPALLVSAALLACVLTPAMAEAAPRAQGAYSKIEADLAEQSRRLADQERRLAEQDALIRSQRTELDKLKLLQGASLDAMRAAGMRVASDATAPDGSSQVAQADRTLEQARQVAAPPPERPVGEAPSTEQVVAQVAAIPEGMGVLTPRRRFVFEPSVEYSRSSSNRLVFRGVEIVPGIQLGVIEANDADRDTLGGALTGRYGLTDRIEIEARIPYIYRRDRVTTVAQRDETVARTIFLQGRDIGDVEVAGRYQINRGAGGGPVFVANLRVKSDTGLGPYDVKFDQFGVASELATGSGFWSIEPSVTMLLPSDPAVIFANLSYGYNLPRNIDKTLGGVRVGRVEPGASIGLGLGFGLALNSRFSFSLGYSHSYISPTTTELGATEQRSNSLQVGSMTMGWSYRLRPGLTLSNNFEFGVTSDAPDMRAVVRLPIAF